jgi:hypothetical protein
MKLIRTAALAVMALALVLAFSQADAAGKAGGKKDDTPAGWDQGTKKGWEGDQPPGTDKAKDKADAEAKKVKGEASAQKKKAEGDAQKAKDDAVKKTDKTAKGQQAGAKAKGSAAVEKAIEKPAQ